MSSKYFPTYSTARNEIVDVKLNLSNYVTQKEFKNLTKVDTSDFPLKTNVVEIKSRVDDIDVNKMNIIDELQGKNYVESSYLYFDQKYEYFGIHETNPHNLLSWRSAGISNEKFEQPEDKNAPKMFFDEIWPHLTIDSFKFLSQKKFSYTHENIMPDVTDAKGPDIVKYGLFRATAYTADKKLVAYGVGFGPQKYTHEDRNLAILGEGSSNSNNALVLGMGSIKITTNDEATVQAKDKLKTNCTIFNKKFVLSVHYNASDDNSKSFLFVSNIQIYEFKANKNEMVARKSNLGSISDNSVLNYNHTLNGNIYHFSVDHESVTTDKMQ